MQTRTQRTAWRWRRMPSLLLSLLLGASMLATVAPPAQAAPQTIRVSVDAGGAEGNGLSNTAAISADGRYVAYASRATNLVTPDGNGTTIDIHVWDRLTGQVSRASVASDGTQANGNSAQPAISADGCVVAFQSSATNLVSGVGGTQIYARNRCAGTTELVSAADGTATTAGNGTSSRPSISDDGRYAVFTSLASNLVSGDTNGVSDVFVRDRVAQTTTRVSVSSGGAQLVAASDGGAISGNGSLVAFHTADTAVLPGLSGATQVFVRGRTSAASVEVVSQGSAGIGDSSSSFASLSRDGSRVAFRSNASNLVPGDTNARQDIFVRDRAAGTTRRVSVDSNGAQSNAQSANASISADGQVVVFHSTATNLVTGDANARQDVFAHTLSSGVTELVSVSSGGTQANLDSFVVDGMAPALSGDGQYVVFHSGASNLVSGDTNGAIDVFLRQRDTTDTTAPQVSASTSGTLGSNGWYVSDVTVTWSVSDPESGIASSTGCETTTITTDGTTTLTCSATNGAGLTTNASVTVKRDTTAPSTTASASPAANANGWNNTAVTVTLTPSDATSGVEVTQYRVDAGAVQTYTAPFAVSGDGTHSVEYFSRDSAGNVEATRSLSVRIDTTAPTVTAGVAGTAGQNGWYVSDVTVTASGTDAGSGIEAGSCTSVTITTEGASQPATVSCRDLAGNTGSASVSVSIDKTAPTTAASAGPAANANGWNNTDVTVTLSASDGTSGVKELTYSAAGAQAIAPTTVAGASATISVTAEGQTTLSFFARDNAGNAEVAKSITVKIDKTPPAVTASRTPGPNANGWNNSDVTVSASGTDGLSGVEAGSCTTVVVSTEGAGQTATVTCRDLAGNTGSATANGISIDKTAPTVTFGAPTPAPNANGWNSSDVSIPFTSSDNLSGVASTTPGSSPLVLTAEGAAVSGTVTVTDQAGNVATITSPAVKIDKTPPAVTASRTPGPNANGWNNTDVTVTGAGTDGLSGIDAASCTSVTLTSEGAGQSATVSCQDLAGNSAAATASDINIDKTAPAVSVQGPADLNEGDSGTWQADALDNLSGVDSIAWDLNNDGSFADASGPSASRTFSDDAALPIRARATDKAGNAAVGALNVVVHNVAPTANAGPPQTVLEGTTVTLSGSATDPGADTHTFVWDFGDGSPTATGQTVTHTYTAAGEYTVTLTVTDDDDGVGTATTTVTVKVNLGVLGRYVAFSTELTWLRNGVKVLSGDVGANGTRSGPGRDRRDDDDDDDGDDDDDNRGPSRDRRAEVILGPRVSMLEAISRVVGDTVWLRSGVEVFNVFFNELQKHRRATIQGDQTEGVDLPVLTLPALPVINPGTQDVEVRRNQTLTLAPGAYRKITVQQGATLILNGVYHIATLDVKNQGKVHFRGRSEVRIKNEMDTDNRAYIGPDPAISGLRASDIVLYVEGGDDRRGSGERDEEVGPTVVQIGTRNTILANVYAPNGTVWLKNDTKATGAFIGKRVRIGEHVELTLDSAF